jgi:DNA-binding transcriptional LysR family regulator
MIAIAYQVFFEVASHLSFSKAADALFLSQPAVSKHIKNLENQLEASLFDRNGNSISLTPHGKKLYEYLFEANNIKKQLEYELSILTGQQQRLQGSLRLGASTTVSLYILPKIISRFHKGRPNVHIHLLNRNSDNILKSLLNKEIDLAIIEGHNKNNRVSYTRFAEEEVIAVCSKNSPFANRTLEVKELKQVPMALRERGSGTLYALLDQLEKHGLQYHDLNVKVNLGGTEALKNFLIEDVSLGFLPRISVLKELQSGNLVQVNIPGLLVTRHFYFCMRQGENSYGLLREFIHVVEKEHKKI